MEMCRAKPGVEHHQQDLSATNGEGAPFAGFTMALWCVDGLLALRHPTSTSRKKQLQGPRPGEFSTSPTKTYRIPHGPTPSVTKPTPSPPAADAPMRRPARPNGDGPWAPLGRCQSSGPPAEASAPPGANWARPREELLSGAPQHAWWPFFKVAKTRGSFKRVLKKGVPNEFHAKMSTNLAKTQVPTTMNARQTRKVQGWRWATWKPHEFPLSRYSQALRT